MKSLVTDGGVIIVVIIAYTVYKTLELLIQHGLIR